MYEVVLHIIGKHSRTNNPTGIFHIIIPPSVTYYNRPVLMLGRNDAPHPAFRIGHISLVARNQVHVYVKD